MAEKMKSDKMANSSLIKQPIMIFAIIFNLWTITAFSLVIISAYNPRILENTGQFGDSFGILNTLFSGLAFGAVVLTIWEQKDQAHQDRQFTSRQIFEATFFEMNKIARESKNSISLTYSSQNIYCGVDAANHLRELFSRELTGDCPWWNNKNIEAKCTERQIRNAFQTAMKRIAMFSEFIAFFAIISSELDFLNRFPPTGNDEADKEDKERLLEIVRASLDSSTLALMLLYGLGDEKTTENIIKYDLAKYMNHGEVWKLCNLHYPILPKNQTPIRTAYWNSSSFEGE